MATVLMTFVYDMKMLYVQKPTIPSDTDECMSN